MRPKKKPRRGEGSQPGHATASSKTDSNKDVARVADPDESSEDEIAEEGKKVSDKDSIAEADEERKEETFDFANLDHVGDIREAVKIHCKLGEKKKISGTHYKKLVRHMSKELRRQKEALESAAKFQPEPKPEADANTKLLHILLRASVGKLSRVFFYPTKKVASAKKDMMKAAGIVHNAEFAKAVRNDLVNRWPKDKDVKWMKSESWKGLFDGEFEVNVGIDSVLLLKECRNLHSTRVSATIGMWEFVLKLCLLPCASQNLTNSHI